MLRHETDPDCNPATHHTHRPRVYIDGQCHIPVRNIDALEGIGWGTGIGIDYPPGEGWATTHVGNLRFCAWFGGIR